MEKYDISDIAYAERLSVCPLPFVIAPGGTSIKFVEGGEEAVKGILDGCLERAESAEEWLAIQTDFGIECSARRRKTVTISGLCAAMAIFTAQ